MLIWMNTQSCRAFLHSAGNRNLDNQFNSSTMTVSGNIIDIDSKSIFHGQIEIADGIIRTVKPDGQPRPNSHYILPGFIDAHVHVESSMLVPSEFARIAVVHGTVATVSDPHEIANVLGVGGVEYMIRSGKLTPFKFYFGAPSCVPATTFETAGAAIGVAGIEKLLQKPEIRYLAEMMNWPGVLHADAEVMAKIALAKRFGKIVDGHAPGLKGEQANRYAAAGISTDHECFTFEEAFEKLQLGMKILIREGSAAKNFDALAPLLHDHADNMMFCSDDKHPDSLEEGHINQLVKRALALNIDLFKVLKAACINPIDHYGLNVGKLRVGDPADFIVIDNLDSFRVVQTFIDGNLVAENGRSHIPSVRNEIVNNFSVSEKSPRDFELKARTSNIRVIDVMDGQLVTNEVTQNARIENGLAVSNVERDILKIAVVNRYSDSKPAIAFVGNFNLKRGAIASSVGHDSHNIIVVGIDDDAIAEAVNMIVREKGGVSAVADNSQMILPLPVGGIMSAEDGYDVARKYQAIDRMAKAMGSTLHSPFMTLSFMALLVIPSLKLSDKGLFDGNRFQFTDVFVD
jgi:adenine deaminase